MRIDSLIIRIVLIWVVLFIIVTCVIIKDSTDVNVGFGNDRHGQGGIEVNVNRADTVHLDSIR